MEIWEPKAPENHWATPGLLRASFNFYILQIITAEFVVILIVHRR